MKVAFEPVRLHVICISTGCGRRTCAAPCLLTCRVAVVQTAVGNHAFNHPRPPLPAPQALQWLRHGCLPVIVVEGEAPAEKRAEQQVGASLAKLAQWSGCTVLC